MIPADCSVLRTLTIRPNIRISWDIHPTFMLISGGSQGISPTYERAHVGLDLLTLASLNTNIQNTKKQNTNLSINLSALGTDYKAGGIKSNLTEGSRILYRHDGRDFKEEDGKRTDSITAGVV